MKTQKTKKNKPIKKDRVKNRKSDNQPQQQQVRQQPYAQSNYIHQFGNMREIIEQDELKNQQFKKHDIPAIKRRLVILKSNLFYKIYWNVQAQDRLLQILNGVIQVNGEKFQSFKSEQASSLLFQPTLKTQNSKAKMLSSVLPKLFDKLGQLDKRQKTEIEEWIKNSLDYRQENLLIVPSESKLQISKKPWQGLEQLVNQNSPSIILIGGTKNSGKSTLSSFLFNSHHQSVILDIDIGKNTVSPGCISLITKSSRKAWWIGQLTPNYNIKHYLEVISTCFNLIRQQYFTSNVLINTMGYLSGLGQILFLEVFNIVKPNKVVLLQQEDSNFNAKKSISKIKEDMLSGGYLERLLYSKNQAIFTSTKVINYENKHALVKNAQPRFQNIFSKSAKSLDQLILSIQKGKMNCFDSDGLVYLHKKNGQKIPIIDRQSVNMKLIVLGVFCQNLKYFSFKGFGFGWNGKIYYDKSYLLDEVISAAIISQGIDFEKSFYQINQKALIMLELAIQKQIPFLEINTSNLGQKSLRNLPSKKALAFLD